MGRRMRYLEYDRKVAYNNLYGSLSVVIEWDTGRMQIPYVDLLLCSKKELSRIVKFAAQHGGWKIINHNEEGKDAVD